MSDVVTLYRLESGKKLFGQFCGSVLGELIPSPEQDEELIRNAPLHTTVSIDGKGRHIGYAAITNHFFAFPSWSSFKDHVLESDSFACIRDIETVTVKVFEVPASDILTKSQYQCLFKKDNVRVVGEFPLDALAPLVHSSLAETIT